MIKLTDTEKKIFKQWIVENVDPEIVPGDEGNVYALQYNLVMLLEGSSDRYSYKEGQDAEIMLWYHDYGISDG